MTTTYMGYNGQSYSTPQTTAQGAPSNNPASTPPAYAGSTNLAPAPAGAPPAPIQYTNNLGQPLQTVFQNPNGTYSDLYGNQLQGAKSLQQAQQMFNSGASGVIAPNTPGLPTGQTVNAAPLGGAQNAPNQMGALQSQAQLAQLNAAQSNSQLSSEAASQYVPSSLIPMNQALIEQGAQSNDIAYLFGSPYAPEKLSPSQKQVLFQAESNPSSYLALAKADILKFNNAASSKDQQAALQQLSEVSGINFFEVVTGAANPPSGPAPKAPTLYGPPAPVASAPIYGPPAPTYVPAVTIPAGASIQDVMNKYVPSAVEYGNLVAAQFPTQGPVTGVQISLPPEQPTPLQSHMNDVFQSIDKAATQIPVYSFFSQRGHEIENTKNSFPLGNDANQFVGGILTTPETLLKAGASAGGIGVAVATNDQTTIQRGLSGSAKAIPTALSSPGFYAGVLGGAAVAGLSGGASAASGANLDEFGISKMDYQPAASLVDYQGAEMVPPNIRATLADLSAQDMGLNQKPGLAIANVRPDLAEGGNPIVDIQVLKNGVTVQKGSFTFSQTPSGDITSFRAYGAAGDVPLESLGTVQSLPSIQLWQDVVPGAQAQAIGPDTLNMFNQYGMAKYAPNVYPAMANDLMQNFGNLIGKPTATPQPPVYEFNANDFYVGQAVSPDSKAIALIRDINVGPGPNQLYEVAQRSATPGSQAASRMFVYIDTAGQNAMFGEPIPTIRATGLFDPSSVVGGSGTTTLQVMAQSSPSQLGAAIAQAAATLQTPPPPQAPPALPISTLAMVGGDQFQIQTPAPGRGVMQQQQPPLARFQDFVFQPPPTPKPPIQAQPQAQLPQVQIPSVMTIDFQKQKVGQFQGFDVSQIQPQQLKPQQIQMPDQGTRPAQLITPDQITKPIQITTPDIIQKPGQIVGPVTITTPDQILRTPQITTPDQFFNTPTPPLVPPYIPTGGFLFPPIPTFPGGGGSATSNDFGKLAKRGYTPDLTAQFFGITRRGRAPAAVTGLGVQPIYMPPMPKFNTPQNSGLSTTNRRAAQNANASFARMVNNVVGGRRAKSRNIRPPKMPRQVNLRPRPDFGRSGPKAPHIRLPGW